ncbi:type IV pilus twitching motility protein PilT [Romeria aff. gracilis LEGE 07310]|uniref:Type IV pilus twitching motility protein PilT n=1 Tax=Vasconcelosia minhoensis LEGE 07310 TaxID=915328 RepID=A0A8J7AJ84_9CYAN|nr:type IV pilus twitching motility protein PilT [Romeria gracilis]MBE9080081.1 type IV pilus twitching motility protein PilT [Romeria aff. gracilis LEGE 07310]
MTNTTQRPPLPPPPPPGRPVTPPPPAATPAAAAPANPPAHRAAAPPPLPTAAGMAGQVTLKKLAREAFDKGYSDLHVGVGEIPRFRNRGEIDTTDYPITDEETFYGWLAEVMTPEQIQEFKLTLDFDGAAEFEFSRIRINIFDSLRGPALVIRLIPVEILTIEQLSLPPVIRDICHYHKGLILVTGPTGSGKSTTLAAMIDYINKDMAKNIITIEDPVEFVHKSRRSLIKQREVGVHTKKFQNALKASLREDPDIILVGEMRDRETIDTALKAAQTGHLVFGTLHTNSAVKTVERILGMYEPEQQAPVRIAIAESLVGVVAQGLCRTTDGKRAAFHEILINTDAIKDYMLRGQLDEIEAILPKCTFDGMCTMNQSLYALYEAGRITEEVALEQSPKQNEMAQMLRGRV